MKLVVGSLQLNLLRNRDVASTINLSDIQLERLKMYVMGIMTFESVCDAVTLLLKKYLLLGLCGRLSEVEGMVAIARVLQGRTWDSIYEELKIGKVRATNILRVVTAKMLKDLYNIDVKPPEL